MWLIYFHDAIHSWYHSFMIPIISVDTHKAKSQECPDPNIFLWIAVSVADTAAIDPNGIKTLEGSIYFSLMASQF